MLAVFWHDFLYQPLFNLLIWVYANWTDHNFGWAIVIVTVLLRVVLLPFTILTEKDKVKNETLVQEIKRVDKDFHHDSVLKKEEIRRAMKKQRVHPWAKIVVLGVQLLVLVLLYQVFLRGITGEKMLQLLYPFMDFPGTINTNFYGFDLGARYDFIWSGVVGLLLVLEIYLDFKRMNRPMRKEDLLYLLLFPGAVAFFLYMLPIAKSLFVLTSMLFSAIIYQFTKVFFAPKAPKAAHGHGGHH